MSAAPRQLPPPSVPDPVLRQDLPLRTDLTTRAAYSGDASVYRRFPDAVLLPRSVDDLRAGLSLAADRGWAVVPRGGGTSVAGNAIGGGLVIDHSAGFGQVLAVDRQARTARVRPGVVCDTLRVAAAAEGLDYGPDPSTHSRCTLGGMAGNNACGSHSVAYGTTADSVVQVGMLLADGRELTAYRGGCSEPDVEARLRELVTGHAEAIRAVLGRFPRQVSGYGLHHLLPENGFDVAKALVGSEGTCGVFTELTVRLIQPPAATALLVLGYPDIYAAAAAAARLRGPGVLTLEGMGADLIDAFRAHPVSDVPQHTLDALPPGRAWLYCEIATSDAGAGAVTGDVSGGSAELADRARRAALAVLDRAVQGGPVSGHSVVTDPVRTRQLWRIRERAAGIATRRADGAEAWPGWEDSAVPTERLADYLRELTALMARHGRVGIPFGHFGEGCVHIRIDFDLAGPSGPQRYRQFLEDAADLVARYGGSVSGEHGDGRARSSLLGRMYSPEMLALFARFKAVFDPSGMMNPGVLVNPDPVEADLRPGPQLHQQGGRLTARVAHALPEDSGSFPQAVTRCVGVGLCRSQAGAMCPSYQVTGQEVASTRGRARVLAEMLHGEHLTQGWRSQEVLQALDLCLSCKACASECPVHVDMATYKAEFLYQHYRGRVRPRSHYAMGWLPMLSAALSLVPGAAATADRALQLPWVATAAKALAGVEPRRRIISFAPLSFPQWFAERARRGEAPTRAPDAEQVVLWPDTFTSYHAPLTGIAAVAVLEALGYRVTLPRGRVCCGLTWHSTGQLGMARRVLRHTLAALDRTPGAGPASPGAGPPQPGAAPATPGAGPATPGARPARLVVLEPSCAASLREAGQLLPDDPRAAALADRVRSLADVVNEHPGPLPFRTAGSVAVTQVHCHQRATTGFATDLAVLAAVGVTADLVQAGCCGLAGNFGFEPGHWQVSQACAERDLYPRVRDAGPQGLVLADGFSCRTQISQGTHNRGRHLAELLWQLLPPTDPPARLDHQGD